MKLYIRMTLIGIFVFLTFACGRVYANGMMPQSCWGQASSVFARMGEMGEHASLQPTPRLGLRNLARSLADAGVLADDSLQALGEFVAGELGLTIEACIDGDSNPMTPRSCWGQASRVFAQMGAMGEHASQEPTPRLGLRNLARSLADAGVLADDSLQALGEFVAAELGLTIEGCM